MKKFIFPSCAIMAVIAAGSATSFRTQVVSAAAALLVGWAAVRLLELEQSSRRRQLAPVRRQRR
jgi:type II secretory pathway component PulK